ncbi:MAG: hypothetical protein ACYDDC_02000, partial [Thermoplasmataceae archaeon]
MPGLTFVTSPEVIVKFLNFKRPDSFDITQVLPPSPIRMRSEPICDKIGFTTEETPKNFVRFSVDKLSLRISDERFVL